MQHDRCQLVFSVSLFRVCELNDVTVLVSSLVDAYLVSHVIHSGQLWRCGALEVLCTLFQEVRVQALQGSLCCVLERDTFSFTVYHLTQFYKCVPVN